MPDNKDLHSSEEITLFEACTVEELSSRELFQSSPSQLESFFAEIACVLSSDEDACDYWES